MAPIPSRGASCILIPSGRNPRECHAGQLKSYVFLSILWTIQWKNAVSWYPGSKAGPNPESGRGVGSGLKRLRGAEMIKTKLDTI